MHLNIIAEGPVFAIHQSDETMDKMDSWNKGTHGRSGLIERVKTSSVDEAQAEAELIAFLRQYVPAGKSPMCGNTICQDRRFMVRTMPKLEAFFHYRNLDVSTLKKHTALADILESIEELKYYREHFIKL
jgi:oligoribonuclease